MRNIKQYITITSWKHNKRFWNKIQNCMPWRFNCNLKDKTSFSHIGLSKMKFVTGMKIPGRLEQALLWLAIRKQCQTATADMTILLFTFDLFYDMDIDRIFSLNLINTSDKSMFYILLWAIGLTWVSRLFVQFSLIITLNPLITCFPQNSTQLDAWITSFSSVPASSC